MKVIVNLIDKTLKILENERNIYVGNNNADVLKLYCYNGGYHLENEFVSITGLLSNGRKIGAFTTDSAYDEEYIDGKLHTLANFTLTKQNGFTLSEGQLNITVWHNKTNDSGAIISKQAIGNLLFNVVKTTNVDENIIITDASGDVIYNFKLEIENIQSAVNSINNELLLKADKSDIPTKTSQLDNDADYIDSERLADVVDSLEAQIQRGGRTYFYSYDLTINNTVKELISKLKSYDKFDENNKGKFYIELSDGTVLEYISIEISSSRYYINSIIYKRTSIEVFQGQLPTTTTKTIEQLINEHKAITTKDYVDEKVANLVNSAPSTLDTLGELAAALEDNKEVVEVLNEAITKKADITYVDEKIANAGVPTDLLNRVETLETKIPTKTSQLTNDSAFINQTQLDEALANVGGGGSEVKLYAHNIELTVEDIYVWFTIYNLSSTPLNLDNLKTYYGIWYPASIMDDNANPDNFLGIIRISNDGTAIDIYGSPYDEGNENKYIYKENLNINQAYFADYVTLISSTTASSGTGSGASGKEVVEITNIHQTNNYEADRGWVKYLLGNFNLSNKYATIDLMAHLTDMEQGGALSNIFIDLTENITNATLFIKIPGIQSIGQGCLIFIDLIKPYVFIVDEVEKNNQISIDGGGRWFDGAGTNAISFNYPNGRNMDSIILKIDFNEQGFATIYVMNEYDM